MQILYTTPLHAYFKRKCLFIKEKLWKVLMFRNVLHPVLWASLSPEWESGCETQMGMWTKTSWLEASEGMKSGDLLDMHPTTAQILITITIYYNCFLFRKYYLKCGKRLIFSPQHRAECAPGLSAGCGGAGGCRKVLPAGSAAGRAAGHGWLCDPEGEFPPQHLLLSFGCSQEL